MSEFGGSWSTLNRSRLKPLIHTTSIYFNILQGTLLWNSPSISQPTHQHFTRTHHVIWTMTEVELETVILFVCMIILIIAYVVYNMIIMFFACQLRDTWTQPEKEMKMRRVFLPILWLAVVFYLSMTRRKSLIKTSFLDYKKCQMRICSCKSIQHEFVFVYERIYLENNVTLCVFSAQRRSDISVP